MVKFFVFSSKNKTLFSYVNNTIPHIPFTYTIYLSTLSKHFSVHPNLLIYLYNPNMCLGVRPYYYSSVTDEEAGEGKVTHQGHTVTSNRAQIRS